jgi:tetratricopeptide (TPR) repeat protein
VFQGRFREAEEHIRRSQDLDPFSTAGMLNVASLRTLEGRFQESREMSQKIAAAYPNVLVAQLGIAGSYVHENQPQIALQLLQHLDQSLPAVQMWTAMTYAKAGQREQALRLIAPYEAKYPDLTIPTQWFALVYALMGDEADTVKWLERAADRHEWGTLNLLVNPAYAAVRKAPGFRALEKRVYGAAVSSLF